MKDTWILVADAAGARLFERGKRWDQLTLREKFDHPEGRAHEGDLVTGDGAAVMQSTGQGQQRQTESEVSATEHVAEQFASQLASRLRDGRVAGEFEELVLVASPEFLGRLRNAIDDETTKCTVHELNKNYTQYSANKLGAVLQEQLGL